MCFRILRWDTNEKSQRLMLHDQTAFNFKLFRFGQLLFAELSPLCIPMLSEAIYASANQSAGAINCRSVINYQLSKVENY